MRAFANGDRLASRLVSWWGYNADKIASALIGNSNQISIHGKPGFDAHAHVEKVLCIRAERARRNKPSLGCVPLSVRYRARLCFHP